MILQETKGSIIGTCGHELVGPMYVITIQSQDKRGEPCLDTLTVCRECRDWYKQEGLLVSEYLAGSLSQKRRLEAQIGEKI